MKIISFILVSTVLCIFAISPPGFAEEFSPSRSLQIDRDFLVAGHFNPDYSDSTLPDGMPVEGGSLDRSERLLLSAAGEPLLLPGELEEGGEDYLEEQGEDEIADPLEPINRAFFFFNDKLYFIVLKPVSKGYATVIPEDARIGIRNAFNNITMPIRFVSCLLQFKIKSAGNELLRFGLNSTLGLAGLFDVAESHLDVKMKDEDLGQTLGVWGMGPVFYINLPVLGPSSLRDSIGLAGDYFLDPVNYVTPYLDRLAIKAGDKVNRASLSMGQYEDLKKDALDPYAAFRDIYHQYRKNKIKK